MRKLICASVVVLFAAVSAAANSPDPFLWGSLTRGRYRVGFRTEFLLDASRTWKTTRLFGKPFSPDSIGRPIRLDVWYPALPTSHAAMRISDYMDAGVAAPAAFAHLRKILEQRDRSIISLDVPADAVHAFMNTRVNAVRNAGAARGRFPLVLYFGGLNDAATLDVSVMAEFLASHGYIVATIALIGSQEDDANQSRTAIDLDATVRDAEFAWSILRHEKSVHPAGLATVGYSVGGIEAVLLAMRNRNVSSVIGMDGTYHFAGAAQVLTGSADYVPRTFAAALLDLRRSSSQDIDLSAVKALRHSERLLVALPKMHHSDFSSFAIWAERFHLGNSPGYVDPSGWTRQTGYVGYQAVCRIVLHALDRNLRHSVGAEERLSEDVAHIGGTIEDLAAVPQPPSIREFAAIIAGRGFDAATKIVDELDRDDPGEEIVKEQSCNALGYELTAEKNHSHAVGVFRLCAYTHPASANAQDSLADGYLGAGQKDLAIAAYERAAALAPNDDAIPAEGKKVFADAEMAKARQLRQTP